MFRFSLCLGLILSFGLALNAQTPDGIILNRTSSNGEARMCMNDAGEIDSFGPITGQSNDNLMGDTIFLCLNDTLAINHDENSADLGTDPNLDTDGGIGYAFYSCPPTATGPDTMAIGDDPCVLTSTGSNFLVFTGFTRSGDVDFFNSGELQTTFFGGGPGIVHFAPITFDSLVNGRFAGYEGNPPGSCVNVRPDQAFAVAYLNAIEMTNLVTDGCGGSFTISGGLPELDGSNYTSLSLERTDGLAATITSGPITSGGVVNFTIPEGGDYILTVEDGKSCGLSTTISLRACGSVIFDLPLSTVQPATNKCFPITVANFDSITSFQFSINWDPTVLDATGIQSRNPDLLVRGNITASWSDNAMVNPGNMIVSWGDISGASDGITLPDGSVVFEICFDAVGQLGDFTTITISGDPRRIEVVTGPGERIPLFSEGGVIRITDDPFFALVTTDSTSCSTSDDGAFTVQVDEGVAPYRFVWNTEPPTQADEVVVIADDGGSATISGLLPGAYGVTITDSSVPPLEIITAVVVDAGPLLGVDIVFDPPSCFDSSDGTVSADVLINTIPITNTDGYTFEWNVTPENTSTLTNRPAGFYSVEITDQAGCTAFAALTGTAPSPVTVLTQDQQVDAASCSGGENGQIDITPSGGTVIADGNYSFQWSTGLTIRAQSSNLPGLNPGEYCVTITDDNMCSFTDCYTIRADKTLSIVPVVVENVNCAGGNDGRILIEGRTFPSGETTPYTFSWNSTPSAPINDNVSSEITALTAGMYIVTMTDTDPAGCEIIDTFIITEPLPLVASAQDVQSETCIVGNDGGLSVVVSGGTGAYTYNWLHDPMLTDSVATGLSANTYTVEVRDANNCLETVVQQVGAPDPPVVLTLNDDSVTCADDTDGALLVTADPAMGDAIESYAWSNGGTGPSITALPPGEYIVTITNANNRCTVVDTAYVTAPDSILVDDFTIRPPSCPDEDDAQISVVISGGTPPYIYNWSSGAPPGPTANPNINLNAGTYTLNVFDANNCAMAEDAVFVVEDPPSIVAANVGVDGFTNVQSTRCPEDTSCDGQATFTAMYSDGTIANFTYTWSSEDMQQDIGVPSSTATRLCEGMNTVTVGDGVCGNTFEFEVEAPEDIAPASEIEPVDCNGEANGSITLTATGGTMPYTYFWIQNGATTNRIEDLTAGVYSAIITDANDCILPVNVTVQEPEVLSVSFDALLSTDFVTCSGDEDGVIVARPTGGNANAANPYNFTWSNGPTTDRNEGLAAGTYTVVVTDFKGCEDEASFTIQEPDPVSFALEPIVPPLCFGDPTTISIDTAFGGANNAFEEYVFMIDNNGLRVPVIQPLSLFAGDHIVTVEDINGCPAETDISIPSPGQITVTIPGPIVVELGDSLTQLQPAVTPGGNYTYSWTPSVFLSSDTVQMPFVYPANSQEYTLVVVNENGCDASASVFVELDANRNVFVPNIFSPNDDGINDYFQVFACKGVRSINTIRIFDRWGGLLYEEMDLRPDCLNGTTPSGASPGWEGRGLDDQLMPAGVYVYMIEVEFLDDVKLTYRGDVTIVR